MNLPRTAATDAIAVERALLDEPKLSVGRIGKITGLHLGRVAKAIAYLAGAGRLAWEGFNPTLYSIADGASPTFDHVYATLEDVSEELAEAWLLAQPAVRNKIECCQVWLMRAMAIIDGEELPDRGKSSPPPLVQVDMSTKQGTYEWAIERAKGGAKVRRACWPFFYWMEWYDAYEQLAWRCGLGHVNPTTLDTPNPTLTEGAMGQTLAFESPPHFIAAQDWETVDPTWKPHSPGASPADAFVVIGHGAGPRDGDSAMPLVLGGSPPPDSVRALVVEEMTPSERKIFDHGVPVYAQV